MDWQQMMSLGIVALSALLLVRSEIQKRKRSRLTACARGCGWEGSAAVEKDILNVTVTQRHQS